MNQILGTDRTHHFHNPVILLRDETETQTDSHPSTLDEIQRQAYRVHREHGGVTGGYTLDDWLEAEHELEDKPARSGKKDQVH
jgi:hypothetical protein